MILTFTKNASGDFKANYEESISLFDADILIVKVGVVTMIFFEIMRSFLISLLTRVIIFIPVLDWF